MSNSVSLATHLGRSAEDYLEAVYVASLSGKHVRVTDIANELGVSKPSVVSALAGLKEKGLVRHERYRGVDLTARGAAVADEVYRRHRFLTEFLTGVLGVPEAVAEREACEIEHVLCPETIRRLVEMVKFCRTQGGETPFTLSNLRDRLSHNRDT